MKRLDFYFLPVSDFFFFFKNFIFSVFNFFFKNTSSLHIDSDSLQSNKAKKSKKELELLDRHKKYLWLRKFKKSFYLFTNDSFFFFWDFILIRGTVLSKKIPSSNRLFYRLKNVDWSFYKKDFFLKNYFLYGLFSFWNSIRFWIVGIVLFALSFYYLMYIRLLPFNKLIFEWCLVIMFLYWLISGFVFFVKKYQYSKFTTVINRFWKRTFILFWLIEGGVFLTFFYLTLNASEEPVYMYDQLKLFKTHLFSWRLFFLKIIPVIALIIFSYFLLLNLKWNLFYKHSLVLVLLTLNLIYIVWLEFYQFFYIVSFYGDFVWTFDYDDFLWNLDIEFRRTRLSNNYVTVCLMAKFWHLIFIFVFWVFFILRSGEIKRVRYTLFSANFQNFCILYLMSWLYMYPWLKFLFRRHLSSSYYWFFVNPRDLSFRLFFNDLKLFFFSIFNFTEILLNFQSYVFFYSNESSTETNFYFYRKNSIRDRFLVDLSSSC